MGELQGITGTGGALSRPRMMIGRDITLMANPHLCLHKGND